MKTTCLQSSLTSQEQRQNRLVNSQPWTHLSIPESLSRVFFLNSETYFPILTPSKHYVFPVVSSTCKAALHGVRFNNRTLRLAWHKAVMTLSPVDADEAEPEEDEVCGHLSVCIHLMMSLRRQD